MTILDPTRSPAGAERERPVPCQWCGTGTWNFQAVCHACLDTPVGARPSKPNPLWPDPFPADIGRCSCCRRPTDLEGLCRDCTAEVEALAHEVDGPPDEDWLRGGDR